MKQLIFISLISLVSFQLLAQNTQINGIVLDDKSQPLENVNVYIEGTLDGASSAKDGSFNFDTDIKGTVTLKASLIGYTSFSFTTDVEKFKDFTIVLTEIVAELNEVVVTAGNYLLKTSSTIQKKNAVDLVTTAGSEGDLYKSIALLPGTQVAGADGRLLVRGGSSRESQTYIDDMHVLSPYTATSDNVPSRGRYSPFHFDGISFSMGGYSPEYSQSLSSVLPLYTKDENPVSKIGASIMNVGPGGGGTKAWEKGSASFSFDFTDMTLYNKLFSPKDDEWVKPYRKYSGQNQLRFTTGENSYLKTYISYDRTEFKRKNTDIFNPLPLTLNYNEDNLYLNSTFRLKKSNGFSYFVGIAYGWNKQDIHETMTVNDNVKMDEKELHIKTKASKRFSNLYKLEGGIENMARSYKLTYRDTFEFSGKIRPNITGIFLSNDFNISRNLFLNVSGRLEYTSLNEKVAFLPRVALNYEWKDISFSGVVGRYQQNTENDYLLYNPELKPETTTQYLLGVYYQKNDKIYRAEFYYKDYDNLPLSINENYTSKGYGHSRGIDLFFNDRNVLNRFEYMLAYSFNDSKRFYLNYPVKAVPTYVTKHNASVTLKYTNWKWKSTIGLTNRFASGRPYHNPNKEGFNNSMTPCYNSLDFSWTYLATPKVIVYASASNILNKKNIYGYNYNSIPDNQGVYTREPIKLYPYQGFYIGVFITLGKNVAYEATYF